MIAAGIDSAALPQPREEEAAMSTNAQQGLEQFQKHMGQEEGVSDWHQVKQDQINLFADATGDHQFIHVDPERAAKLSPYKVTIAHGFLTLSLIPFLGGKIPPVEPKAYEGVFMGVNYGLDKVRFPSPVKVDSHASWSMPSSRGTA
jgi:acyl dehydratase